MNSPCAAPSPLEKFGGKYKLIPLNNTEIQPNQNKGRKTWKSAVDQCKVVECNDPVILIVNEHLNFLVGASWVPLIQHTFNVTSLPNSYDKIMAWLTVFRNPETKPSWVHAFEWTLHTRFADVISILVGSDIDCPELSSSDGLLFSTRNKYRKSPHLSTILRKMYKAGTLYFPNEDYVEKGGDLRGWAEQGLLLINDPPCIIPKRGGNIGVNYGIPEWGTILVPLIFNLMCYIDAPLRVCVIGDKAQSKYWDILQDVEIKHKKERGVATLYQVTLTKTGFGSKFSPTDAFGGICYRKDGQKFDFTK